MAPARNLNLLAAGILVLATAPAHVPVTAAAASGTARTGAAASPASPPVRGAPCFEACQNTLWNILFTDPGGDDVLHPAERPCLSRLAASSLYLCAAEFCTETDRVQGLAGVNETCHNSIHKWLPPLSIVANFTDEDVARLRRFERNEMRGAPPFSEVVLPSVKVLGLMHDTIAAWAYGWRKHLEYSAGLFIFWALVIATGLSYRYLATHSIKRPAKRNGWIPLDDSEDEGEEESQVSLKPPTRSSLAHLWVKRYISLPATFGYRSAQHFGWYTVPPRVQSLTIAAFVVMNVGFCMHGYWVFPENMYWADTHTQWLRYIADRTGIISFANFPLIWLFGTRNNLLLWLTGWDFGTYNNFHRWVARASTVQAIIHSVAYTIQVFESGGWAEFAAYFDQFFWWTGEVATVLMSLLLGFSLLWFRRNTYELFLIMHISFSVVILYTMWAHVTIFNGRFDPPTWACCAIWALDRILRMARTLSFNPRFWSTTASATYDPDADMVRLRVPASTALYKPKPGTFYFLHVLNDPRFWESHPFTMAKLDVDVDAKMVSKSSSSATAVLYSDDEDNTDDDEDEDEEDHLLAASSSSSASSPGIMVSSSSSSSRKQKRWRIQPDRMTDAAERIRRMKNRNKYMSMTFLIRPGDGFTGRLRDAAVKAAGAAAAAAAATSSSTLSPSPSLPPPVAAVAAANLRVLVEGPYGNTQPLEQFDNIIFIVGGSGIAVALSYLSTLLQPLPPRIVISPCTPERPQQRSQQQQQGQQQYQRRHLRGQKRLQSPHSHILQQQQQQSYMRRRLSSTTSITSNLSRHAGKRTRAVRVVWAVRQAPLAEAVLRDDFSGGGGGGRHHRASLLEDERLDVRVHVTRVTHVGHHDYEAGDGVGGGGGGNFVVDDDNDDYDDDDDEDDVFGEPRRVPPPKNHAQNTSNNNKPTTTNTTTTASLIKTTILNNRDNVKTLHGRPSVPAEIADFAADHPTGSVAVVACGPAQMADDARRAVVDLLSRRGGLGANSTGVSGSGSAAGRVVEYFEESFGW